MVMMQRRCRKGMARVPVCWCRRSASAPSAWSRTVQLLALEPSQVVDGARVVIQLVSARRGLRLLLLGWRRGRRRRWWRRGRLRLLWSGRGCCWRREDARVARLCPGPAGLRKPAHLHAARTRPLPGGGCVELAVGASAARARACGARAAAAPVEACAHLRVLVLAFRVAVEARGLRQGAERLALGRRQPRGRHERGADAAAPAQARLNIPTGNDLLPVFPALALAQIVALAHKLAVRRACSGRAGPGDDEARGKGCQRYNAPHVAHRRAPLIASQLHCPCCGSTHVAWAS